MQSNAADFKVDLPIQRASERVRHYLLTEFTQQKGQGTKRRLPSIKLIARHLDVSVGTVQAVLQKLAAEGIVRTQQGSGSFLVEEPEVAPKALRALVSMPIGELKQTGNWLEQIGGGIFTAALQARPSLALEGLTPESFGTDGAVDELLARMDAVDGLLLMPYSLAPQHEYLLETFEKAGKPVITLYSTSLPGKANSVSPDFFSIGKKASNAWVQAGRKRIAIFWVEPASTHFPVIQSFRLGLIDGMGRALGDTVQFQTIPGGTDWTPESAHHAMTRFLATCGEPPDAVFCENDESAEGVIKALADAGLSCPKHVSVLAGSAGPQESAITRFHQPLSAMGERAVELLLERIALRQFPSRRLANLAGELLPSTLKRGTTISAEEERLLN